MGHHDLGSLPEKDLLGSSGDLARAVADIGGLDVELVRNFVRNLRSDGLISTAGRGLSAAPMYHRDAASLVIGILATGSAARAASEVRRLGQFSAACDAGAKRALKPFLVPQSSAVSFKAIVEAVLYRFAVALRKGVKDASLPRVDLAFSLPANRLSVHLTAPQEPLGSLELVFRARGDATFDAETLSNLGVPPLEAGLRLDRAITMRMLVAVAAQVASSGVESQSAANVKDRRGHYEM